MLRLFLALSLCLFASSCTSLGKVGLGPYQVLDSSSAEPIEVEAAADSLSGADVVFLGERHDSDEAHHLQFELTRALHARRPVALSMEMFERDVQTQLDAYLAGEIDEEAFLESTRPWSNYAEHYRPAVEWAKANGIPVIAANLPRPEASEISKVGLEGLEERGHLAAEIVALDDEYRRRFDEAMGSHGEGLDLRKYYEAQVAKDETMAESIALFLQDAAGEVPLVVHWCGNFHSDFGLGTVERVARRLPQADLRVVSTVSGGVRQELETEDRDRGEVLFLVP